MKGYLYNYDFYSLRVAGKIEIPVGIKKCWKMFQLEFQ
jgi:hypothetical protein